MRFFNLFSSKKKTPNQPQYSEAQIKTNLFASLSQTQKFAMFTMLASLAAAPTNAEKTTMVQRMLFTDAAMMGITQNMMLSYTQTHTKSSPQAVISTLRTIKDADVLEWLIYCGFGIITVNQNDKARYVFYDWWQQLGYNPEDIKHIVKKIETKCKQFKNL